MLEGVCTKVIIVLYEEQAALHKAKWQTFLKVGCGCCGMPLEWACQHAKCIHWRHHCALELGSVMCASIMPETFGAVCFYTAFANISCKGMLCYYDVAVIKSQKSSFLNMATVCMEDNIQYLCCPLWHMYLPVTTLMLFLMYW